jgi:hypothetical protein
MLDGTEPVDPIRPAADKRHGVAGRSFLHATIIEAYDWDDVHPSRCVVL